MAMRLVLDTNVIVSALLSPNGAPGELLKRILQAPTEFVLLYDQRIVSEYSEVVSRPKFKIDLELFQKILLALHTFGEWIEVSEGAVLFEGELADRDDLPFAEVAVMGKADVLVTGNHKHFTFLKNIPVKAPADVLRDINFRG